MSDSEHGVGPPEEADSQHVPRAVDPDDGRSGVVYGDEENTPEQQAQADPLDGWSEEPPNTWTPMDIDALLRGVERRISWKEWDDRHPRPDPTPRQAEGDPHEKWLRNKPKWAATPLPMMLEEASTPPRWLVPGFWLEDTFGFVAGEEKTLKSQLAQALALTVATGLPLFGDANHRPTKEPSRVLHLVGEGGRRLAVRRYVRMARALGLFHPDDDPSVAWPELARLLVVDDLGRMDDPPFLDAMVWLVRKTEARLLVLDPFYAYHGGRAEGSSLFAMGDLLARFNEPLAQAGCSLLVVHHTTKASSPPPRLRDMAFAGVAEWADSWILPWHHEPADPDRGEYHLGLRVGSRQASERYYTLRWHDGPVDEYEVTHHADPTWELTRADASLVAKKGERKASDDNLEQQIRLALQGGPKTWRTLESELVGAGTDRKRQALREAVAAEWVTECEWVHRDAGGRVRTDRGLVLAEQAAKRPTNPAGLAVWDDSGEADTLPDLGDS